MQDLVASYTAGKAAFDAGKRKSFIEAAGEQRSIASPPKTKSDHNFRDCEPETYQV
jgi:hypothetical protein